MERTEDSKRNGRGVEEDREECKWGEGNGGGVKEEKRTQPHTSIKMDQSNLIMPRY